MITAKYNFEGFKVVIHTNGVEIFLADYWKPDEGPHYSQECIYENWDEVENGMDDGEDLVYGYRDSHDEA